MLVLAVFRINQQTIEENLCIERNNQGSMCHGSCQLKIRLAENHDNDQKLPVLPVQDQSTVVLYCQFINPLSEIPSIANNLIPKTKHAFPLSEFVPAWFHPPEFAS
jgi:hypothetical protein